MFRKILATAACALMLGGAGLASASAANAALSCSTTTYNTVGKGTCSGSGYWKVKVACQAQPDVYSSRIYQQSGTTSQYGECRFSAQNTYVIIG